jgi:hypothetical protein
MYKLRSMCRDAEARTGPVWASPGADPRVTPLGYWLRRLHLDEIPQLLNVVRGEMALVGPRPERPDFVHVLAAQIPDYQNRLRVPPGITGLAQLNLPPDTDVDCVRRKLVLDREYVESANLWMDCRILLCTALRAMGVKGDCITAWLALRRVVQLPDHRPRIVAACLHPQLAALDLAQHLETSASSDAPSQFLASASVNPEVATCQR